MHLFFRSVTLHWPTVLVLNCLCVRLLQFKFYSAEDSGSVHHHRQTDRQIDRAYKRHDRRTAPSCQAACLPACWPSTRAVALSQMYTHECGNTVVLI
mmetsp:Transcript_43273/g.85362  ORF Transcript_43273/g.85362 Transcript_43273/m.85362 type:complete len:97 (-) Transcript_43273:236-526(-)